MVVFVTGFMGVGKSGTAKKLAGRLRYAFLDSDLEIEKKAGMSVQEIFNTHGEMAFREMEHQWLKNLDVRDTIVALGGGAACTSLNASLVKSKGKSIYLSMPVLMIADRLMHSKHPRPLIASLNTRESLIQYIEKKLEERIPFYSSADFTFDAMDKNLVDKICRSVQTLKPLASD